MSGAGWRDHADNTQIIYFKQWIMKPVKDSLDSMWTDERRALR